MHKPTILIAEDDAVLREVYLRKLSKGPYALRVAGSGEEAARMIGEQAPDLLVCDIQMPKGDGYWVLDQFPKGKRPFPVIMLTNFEDDETRAKCERLADGYFVKKDMDLSTLADMIASLLSKRPRA